MCIEIERSFQSAGAAGINQSFSRWIGVSHAPIFSLWHCYATEAIYFLKKHRDFSSDASLPYRPPLQWVLAEPYHGFAFDHHPIWFFASWSVSYDHILSFFHPQRSVALRSLPLKEHFALQRLKVWSVLFMCRMTIFLAYDVSIVFFFSGRFLHYLFISYIEIQTFYTPFLVRVLCRSPQLPLRYGSQLAFRNGCSRAMVFLTHKQGTNYRI